MSRQGEAYLTVYLSLCLMVIISLYFVLIDGVRRNGVRLEAACVAEVGMQSVMAEYHRELLNQYNLFAIDSSYGTGNCGKQYTEAHLAEYIRNNLKLDDVMLKDFLYRDFLGMQLTGVELTHVSILTDEKGTVFRKCAVDAIKDDVGIGLLDQVKDWIYTAEINGLDFVGIQEEKKRLNEEWENLQGQEVQISEKESVKIDIPNPTEELDLKREKGFLNLVISNPQDISTKAISHTGTLSNRMREGNLSEGNMTVDLQGLWERLLFQEYLMKYMGNYRDTDESNALEYQIEYLLNGKESDVENLKGTALKLCAVRETANVLYLLSDQEKQTQIKNVSALICGLLTVPELTKVMEPLLTLAWASIESVYDVKALYDGGKIPLLKNDESWHYGLKTSMGDQLFGAIKDDTGDGLKYEDYLRIMMAMISYDDLTIRAMDMIEADIRLTPGNALFRLDACYDRFYAVINIKSAYGYEVEVAQKKEYR